MTIIIGITPNITPKQEQSQLNEISSMLIDWVSLMSSCAERSGIVRILMDQGGGERAKRIENNFSLEVARILVFIKARFARSPALCRT